MSVTISTLYNYRQQGRGPVGIPSPRRLAYRLADIEDYLDQRTRAALAPAPDRVHETRPAEPRISRRKPARVGA
jgi:hypothetical protein